MAQSNESDVKNPTLDERRLLIEEQKLKLEYSFGKRYMPALVTIVAGLIAAMFSFAQQKIAMEETKRSHNQSVEFTKRAAEDAKINNEREWGYKVVDLYFSKRDLFDLSKNPQQAAENLRVLSAVAPNVVKGVLNAEQSKIASPNSLDDQNYIKSQAAVAEVQAALSKEGVMVSQSKHQKPSEYTIYVQYCNSSRDTAELVRNALLDFGYKVPGIEKVKKSSSGIQLRYYRHDQRPFAESLVVELGKVINKPTTNGDAELIKSSSELPNGVLELWIP